jgi:hypothetical protein
MKIVDELIRQIAIPLSIFTSCNAILSIGKGDLCIGYLIHISYNRPLTNIVLCTIFGK